MVFPPTIEYQRADTMGGTTGLPARDGASTSSRAEPLALTDDEINRRGLTVVTTIQKPLQDAAVAQVDALPRRHAARPGRRGARTRAPASSLTSVDPKDGAIVALYGGADFLTDQQNTVTYDNVQAGSTFKPFTLIAALEQGVGLDDAVQRAHRRRTFGGLGQVSNFSNGQFGNIDLVEATAQSVNTVYAQLNLQVGAGEDGEGGRARGPPGAGRRPTAPTCSAPRTVQPIDMAGAYATIASGGMRVDPYIVRTVTQRRRHGRVRAQGPDEQAFAAGRHGRHDVRDDPGRREGVRQDVDQAARPTDRRQDRNLARTTSRPGSSASRPNIVTEVSLSQIGRARHDAGDDLARSATVKDVTGGTWPAFLWQSYMKDVFAQPQYAEVLQFPARANVGGKPTPTASAPDGDGRADGGAHAGGADGDRRPGGSRGQARGRRHGGGRQRRARRRASSRSRPTP